MRCQGPLRFAFFHEGLQLSAGVVTSNACCGTKFLPSVMMKFLPQIFEYVVATTWFPDALGAIFCTLIFSLFLRIHS